MTHPSGSGRQSLDRKTADQVYFAGCRRSRQPKPGKFALSESLKGVQTNGARWRAFLGAKLLQASAERSRRLHPSSMENMARCIRWYLPAGRVRVADLGSVSVNGSYRGLFPADTDYIGLDLEAGPGVDLVMEDPYKISLPDGSVDAVVSGQMLEHCAHFWRVFQEINRVLKEDGIAFVIAPSAGPIHRYPVDCYRYYPDAYEALADWSGLRLVHCWLDERGPWRDLVGVFQKGGRMSRIAAPVSANAVSQGEDFDEDPVRNSIGGKRSYLEILDLLHRTMTPGLYCEIGIRKGSSLRLCRGAAIGIDPAPDAGNLSPQVSLFAHTSDDFFFFHEDAIGGSVDLAFIDGMHLAEFVYRDFINLERKMSPGGVIVIDDVFPNHERQASRNRTTRVWTGDVWRFARILERERPDLKLTYLDCAPAGLLLVTNLNPRSTHLGDIYNPTVRRLADTNDEPVPDHVVARHKAIEPTDALVLRAVGLASRPSGSAGRTEDLSIVVCAYEMSRELPRTIATLSPAYQKGIENLSYEIVVLDNGSTIPIDEAELRRIAPNLRVLREERALTSPAKAINRAIATTAGQQVALFIDGARMASPGVLACARDAYRIDPLRVAGSLAFHLGSEVQMESVLQGYDQHLEDALLDTVDWRQDGYRLFAISVLASSSAAGWFGCIAESNGVFLDRRLWDELGGLDERFNARGGGLVNLDFWTRAVNISGNRPFIFLGEGTFHQVHGGAATNGTDDDRWAMQQEYEAIHAHGFQPPTYIPHYVGTLDDTRLSRGLAKNPVPGRWVDQLRGRPFSTALPSDVLASVQDGTLRTRYKGLRFCKNPFDIALYMKLLGDLKPSTIVEIGSSEGGSALWFSDMCCVLKMPDTKIVSIDLQPPAVEVARATFYAGDCTAPATTFPSAVIDACPRPWLVIEDSAHTHSGVSNVLEYFHRRLLPGDYIVVEDGVVADLPANTYRGYDDGPNRAVAEFVSRYPASYKIDEDLCDFYGHNITYCPNAWLRRIS